MAHPTTTHRFSEEDKCFYFPCIFAPNEKTNPKPPAKYLAPIRSVLYEVKEGNPDYHGTPIHAYNAPVAAHTYKGIDIHEDLRTLSTTDILGKNEDTKRTVVKTLRELHSGGTSEAQDAK
jgi:hypothetical protein